MVESEPQIWAVIPAAGVGSRMSADRPKQYLQLAGKKIIEHTLERLASISRIKGIVVAISADDQYWASVKLPKTVPIEIVAGGKERCHSVYNALSWLEENLTGNIWALVHDAARPCVKEIDINTLLDSTVTHAVGGLLALPVRDTMKRSAGNNDNNVQETLSRENLWHALTPQVFPAPKLKTALQKVIENGQVVTDESQAIELNGDQPLLVQGSEDNIKITRQQDMKLAEIYLQHQI